MTPLSSVPVNEVGADYVGKAHWEGHNKWKGKTTTEARAVFCSFSTMRRQKGPSTSSEPFGVHYARVSSVSSPP